jgi:hypothetical protein
MPEQILSRFLKENGNHKGVFALNGNVKTWLKKELGNA